MSDPTDELDPRLVRLRAVPASDSWGFVGTVSVGDFEAYRTLQAYSTPEDALAAVERLVGEALGTLLAGQEWRDAMDRYGHAPRRVELSLGLRGLGDRVDGQRQRSGPTETG